MSRLNGLSIASGVETCSLTQTYACALQGPEYTAQTAFDEMCETSCVLARLIDDASSPQSEDMRVPMEQTLHHHYVLCSMFSW